MGASGSFALMPSGISSGNCSIHPQVRKSAFSHSPAPTRRFLLTTKFKRRLGSLSNGSEYSFLIYFRVGARLKFRFSADGPSSRHLGRLQPTYLLMKDVLRRQGRMGTA